MQTTQPTVTLRRISSGDQGTAGELLLDGVRVGFTIEPPWRNNEPGRSCIPPGRYQAIWRKSPRYGWTYMLVDTRPRAYILCHPGNFGGDEQLGWQTHTRGCILLGTRHGYLQNKHGARQFAVLASRPAVRRFHEATGGRQLAWEVLKCQT